MEEFIEEPTRETLKKKELAKHHKIEVVVTEEG